MKCSSEEGYNNSGDREWEEEARNSLLAPLKETSIWIKSCQLGVVEFTADTFVEE